MAVEITAGASATAVPAVVVVIEPRIATLAVLAKLNAPTPPSEVLEMFTTARWFVMSQVKAAPATTLPAGIVTTLPAKPPIGPVPLPSSAPLASVQLAALIAKPDTAGSTIVTFVPTVVTATGVGLATGVPATRVVMLAGVAARLVEPVKANVPAAPSDVLRTSTVAVAALFVTTQLNTAPAFTLAAGIVGTPAVIVPSAPVPLPSSVPLASVHEKPVRVKPTAGVSVKVTAVPAVVMFNTAGVTGAATPAVIVVIEAGGITLPPRKLNGPPTLPVVIFCSVTVGCWFVRLQVITAPGTRFAAGMLTALPAKVPNVPAPAGLVSASPLASVQLAAVSA